MTIQFTLNGENRSVDADPLARLLDVIRDELGLVGTKEGCGEGECGACAVLIDGKLANSCITPMATVQDSDILTVEGFRSTERYAVIAEAFAEAGAVQCGFCTPGFVMAAAALLQSEPEPDDEQIRRGLAGNLCRCTGYNMIVDGVKLASERLHG